MIPFTKSQRTTPISLSFAFAFALLCATSSSSALTINFGGKSIAGSGHIQQRNYSVSDFNHISVGIGGNIEIVQDGRESLTIETDDNLLEQIQVKVSHGELNIAPADSTRLDDSHTKISIHLKDLRALEIGGGNASGVTMPKLNTSSLKVAIGGSGTVKFDQLTVDDLSVTVGGSGSFKAVGEARKTTYTIGGSGMIDTAKLRAQTATITIGGSGTLNIAAERTLDVTIAGSGKIYYYGDPKISQSTFGSGKIVRAGDWK